ncbi:MULTISPECIES: stage V sporulation T C-terminal domain-containing protein [Desulfitobacterium]|uniref:AbrB family transcriptional regulator, stage V sporulation protein T n=1 Tax=Desulfitobacterium chlororespirans DSM 11544 TaxID=1121395 RepID=A0A1M7UTZ0_9FIRM|nr:MULTISPECIES: stage V sporulation T C-terminal domain-containing protein [Desulfitobacterium]SHN86452.1 AbrB family transcriptional regulator, stage V sporulation protein T [Desulfitobacterium chlororespirans DSM 11544]
MKETGIIRRIDDLGRVVIPKEIRRSLRIKEGDPLEIFIHDGGVLFKRYSSIAALDDFAKEYADSLYKTTGNIVCIADKDVIIAVSGASKKEYLNKPLWGGIEEAVLGCKPVKTSNEVIVPIIVDDYCIGCVGAVILMAKDPNIKMGDMELKLAETAANFLAKQLKA